MNARALSEQERRERGTKLCASLSRDVASIAPHGLGRWEAAWDIVDAPTAEFMVTLSGWEADPTPATLARVSSAYRAVLSAWEEAARRWATVRQEDAR